MLFQSPNGAFYEIFTRRRSPSGQTGRFLDATFAGVTPAEGSSPSTTGCRTPPEWPLGGVLHAALQNKKLISQTVVRAKPLSLPRLALVAARLCRRRCGATAWP